MQSALLEPDQMKLQLDPNNYEACPSYNEWLDEQYSEQSGGTLDIRGYQPRPSFVLFTMSPDTLMKRHFRTLPKSAKKE